MANVQGIFDRSGDAEVADPTEASAFDQPGHEQVVFCQDARTGLRAIIGIYSTELGPALGGTRFYPYASEDEALADVLAGARRSSSVTRRRSSPRPCCAPTGASCSR